jgi:hypothetical protein
MPIYVLGQGGTMDIQMNNDGSILNASKVWRQIGQLSEPGEWLPVKPFDQALDEAMEQLEDADMYTLDSWLFGYKELPGNVEQSEMGVVFQFWFIPRDDERMDEFPPQFIEVSGWMEG